MTRFLSEALQATEPFFRLGLRKLEMANGNPGTDIRFSSEVRQSTQNKLRELGLDPHDTTPQELYRTLQEKIRADDMRLVRRLRMLAASHVSAEADLVSGMAHALRELPDMRRCLALKSVSLRAVLRRIPPKKAMKRLGYRSLDSLLKHEQPVLVLAAAWLHEGENWQKRLLDQYKKLQPSDFEERPIQILHPTSKRWQELARTVVIENHHNLLCFRELGSIILLPLPAAVPPGATTSSLGLALNEVNEIRAASSYLKLCQVRPNFGEAVQTIAVNEAHLSSRMLDQPVPWHLIQRYYARLHERFHAELFEPQLAIEDMASQPIEEALASIEPSLAFWKNTAHLGLLHNGQPVPLNLLDSALSLCNQLPYERRIVHYFQNSLWHELLLRYMHHQPVEQHVLTELQPQVETVIA